jgi:CRISPR-associated protein Csb2
MSVVIKLRFPAGRYHATPWGRHVNEGVPEWPPSAWRILRALVAVWRRTYSDLAESRVRRILEQLASPPRFRLPQFRVAHTRHYMPWQMKGPADRTLVFDTFVCIGRDDPLFVGWPGAEMSPDDCEVLSKLVAKLSFLGRAESWVEAELVDSDVELPLGPSERHDLNPVSVLCPDPVTAFGDEYYPTLDRKKLAASKVSPSDFLFECPRWHLCLDTETIHAEKWPAVPGTNWVNYTRPLEANHGATNLRIADTHDLTIARFMLDGPVLPLATDTIRVAEAFRHGLMRHYQRRLHRQKYGHADRPYRELFRSKVLSGKDASGQFLREHHHAFYLPTAEGNDPRWITHITVASTAGLNPNELAALAAVGRLKVDDESPDLRTQLIGLGNKQSLRASLLEEGNVWTSATPFLVTRHMKRRGQKRDPRAFFETPEGKTDFIKQVLREELERRGLYQDGVEIEMLESVGTAHRLRPIEFCLRRPHKPGDDGPSRPRGLFQLRFPQPVSGPIALGHSCHFGLGLFVPE